jgi:quercetin dioxygenase-like cupin family protein
LKLDLSALYALSPQPHRQRRRPTKEKLMNYTFLANLHQEFVLPEKGILSRVLHKDDHVNVTLFGFSAGQELSAHSAPTPAILYFLEGEAGVQLGEDKVIAQPGSFVYMPPMLTHGISARTALRMLLVQMKDQSH